MATIIITIQLICIIISNTFISNPTITVALHWVHIINNTISDNFRILISHPRTADTNHQTTIIKLKYVHNVKNKNKIQNKTKEKKNTKQKKEKPSVHKTKWYKEKHNGTIHEWCRIVNIYNKLWKYVERYIQWFNDAPLLKVFIKLLYG